MCAHTGCLRQATHGLEIRVWAKGHPKRADNYLTMFMPLELCLGHAAETDPKTFFIDDSWKRIESALMAVDKAPPDRASAEIHPAPLPGVKRMMDTAEHDPRTITMHSPEKMN